MADFKFLQNPLTKDWVILAPRRARRPDIAHGIEPPCPFCVGKEKEEQELYRVGGEPGDQNWLVRVIPNKFPFAPIHEVVIHSPDHNNNFDKLSINQCELIIQTYRQRFLKHQDKGWVYIFHNHGKGGGESLPHPHTQLVVIPSEVDLGDISRLDPSSLRSSGQIPEAVLSIGSNNKLQEQVQTPHFYLFCPQTSQWPDEVWVAPKKRGRGFGEITNEEITDLAHILSRLIQIFDIRHGNEFPFNFYIYPGGDWYLRLIPRTKSLGGFEIGTGIFVNTQNPQETIEFIKTHFKNPDEEKIKIEHQAEYGKSV